MRRLKELHPIFTRGDNILYCLYNPRSEKIHVKTGLSTKTSGRFVLYAIPEGVRFLMVAVVADSTRLYEMEEFMKSQIMDARGERIRSNRCRDPNSRWLEWFKFDSWNLVQECVDEYIKKLQSEGLLLAATKWRTPNLGNLKLRMILGRKAKRGTTAAMLHLNKNLQQSEANSRKNQASNYSTALPILKTKNTGTLYVISDPADDEIKDDIDDEKIGEVPDNPTVHRFKFGYTFDMKKRLVNYATSFPRGAEIHVFLMVSDDREILSMEQAMNTYIMQNGGTPDNSNPYRQTRSEWFTIDRSVLIELMKNFSNILDEHKVLLSSQIFERGGIYPNPANPNHTGIRAARNEVERKYESRSGRLIKAVHQYKRGSKSQMENRFWDSVFSRRDYLGSAKRKTKRLRELQANVDLYDRCWALIRGEFMKEGFDIDEFFKNEKLCEDFLKIKHEVLMKFHLDLQKDKRMAYFEKTQHYDTFTNKTLAQRNAEYQEQKEKHNEVTLLEWCKERRDWRLIHFVLNNGEEKIHLTSDGAFLSNYKNYRTHKVLKTYKNEFYRNAKALAKPYMLEYPDIETVTSVIPDAP